MNRKFIVMLLACCFSLFAFSQGIPDPLEESSSDAIGFISNTGQVTNEDGTVISPSTLFYHSVRTLPNSFYLADKISFVFPKIDQDTSTSDTLSRIDLTWKWNYNEQSGGNNVTPNAYEQTSEIHNFYYEHCPTGSDHLYKYKGILYHNIYPGIDMRIYSNNQWIKIYFIIAPGYDPESVRLTFNGYDNINVYPTLLTLSILNTNIYLP